MDEEIKATFVSLLPDYAYIAKGLKKMGIQHPTDLQEQILSIPQQIDNLIITAPEGSGKRLTLILLALKKFANEEEGTLAFVAHSNQLSQQIASLVSVLSRTTVVNLSKEDWNSNSSKTIVIGSPVKLSKLSKQRKDSFICISIIEADLLLDFGYGEPLNRLASQVPSTATFQLSSIKIGAELDAFKQAWMKKTTKVDYKPAEDLSAPKVERVDGQAVHIHQVGEKMIVPITLYVTLKFGLVNPKVLLLVKDLKEVYRYSLFLERAKISGVGLYNHENPIDLKFYCLQVWMGGPTHILIATPAILGDLAGSHFKENCRKNYKRDTFSLTNLATVICINVEYMLPHLNQVFESFSTKPFIMTILENREEEINALQELIKVQNEMFESVKVKEFPISKKELEAFRYRIQDVFMTLGNNKVDLFQKYDFKKKMLKSPDLKDYFEQNPHERDLLLKEVIELKKKINHEAVTISELVPSYLVPESLRSGYEQKTKEVTKQLKGEELPKYIKKARDALRHVDLEEEDPEITDVSRLKLVSSRKRWKLQHGFKLHKKNKRLEKKGIFTTS